MELFDLYDENNKPLGVTKERSLVHRDGDWHRTSHIYVVNKQGQFLVHLRSPQKDFSPNCWDTCFGGHVTAGMDYKNTAIQELEEEIGIKALEDKLITGYQNTYNSANNREHVQVYFYQYNGELKDLHFSDNEVVDVKWMQPSEIIEAIQVEPEKWASTLKRFTNNFDFYTKISKIKNIIFDLGEVLITGIRKTGDGLTEKYKLELGNIRSPLMIPLVEEFFHGNVSEDKYLGQVLKEFPQLGDREALKQHIRDNFVEIEGTREIALKLKKLGYTIALLSIHGKEWIEYCNQKYNHHELFDVISYSYEEKVSKPHAKAFEIILEKLHAKPEECLFIDDKLKNIEAARRLGIQSIQFTNASDLENELKKILPDFDLH